MANEGFVAVGLDDEAVGLHDAAVIVHVIPLQIIEPTDDSQLVIKCSEQDNAAAPPPPVAMWSNLSLL